MTRCLSIPPNQMLHLVLLYPTSKPGFVDCGIYYNLEDVAPSFGQGKTGEQGNPV